MKSSSSSSSATAGLPSSTSRPPHRALHSPDLQAEFLQERRNRSTPRSDDSDSSASSPPTPPFSPPPCCDSRPARLSLSSPELLSELRASRTRPLRPVPAHTGLTTVFSGRGGQDSGSALSIPAANQRTPR